MSVNFQEVFSSYYIILRIRLANSVDTEEVAHYEPPHLDLHCLKINLFHFLTLTCIALRKAKIVCNFGLSECNRVKNK